MTLTDKAAIFAVNAHSGQRRKAGNIPYILHPMEAATIIAGMTADENVIAAGLLHDTVEDCGISADTIKEEFGEYVYGLVMSETEDKMAELPPCETWTIRKKASLEKMMNSDDINVKILWLGDKLANIRSFYRLYLKEGSLMWERFNQQSPQKQAWYYRSVLDGVKVLEGTPEYAEYVNLVNIIFGEVKE